MRRLSRGAWVVRVWCVNVKTTDATTGATALLLPAQNTHTLHDPIRDTEHARAGGVEDGLGIGGVCIVCVVCVVDESRSSHWVFVCAEE